MDRNRCGVLNIAVGEEAISDALHTAESVKRHSPGLSCTLMADSQERKGRFDQVKQISSSKISKRLNKLENIFQSPYDYTLYVDNDTKINCDIWEMFELLDRFDIALAQDFSRKRKLWADLAPDYARIPYSFPEYCSGVILFKKSPLVKELFDSWRELFEIYKLPFDQPSLRVALWQSRLRIHTLPVEYNVRDEENRRKWDARRASGEENEDHLKTRIFHWRGVHDPENRTKPQYY